MKRKKKYYRKGSKLTVDGVILFAKDKSVVAPQILVQVIMIPTIISTEFVHLHLETLLVFK